MIEKENDLGINIDILGLSEIDSGQGVGVITPEQLLSIYKQMNNQYYIDKKLPTPSRGNVIVTFEHDFDSTVVDQGNGLIVPERYIIEQGDEDADTAWGVTTDRKLINPQLINILSGEYTGRRAFVHYGAFEVAKWLDDHQAFIPEKMILFFVDPIRCMPGTYLGEEVYGELEKTSSGIYLTPHLEEKEGVKVYITHVPDDAHPLVKVGTTVITVDAFQYDLTYDGKKYIKVEQQEIVGIQTKDGYHPVGNTVLVDYLPDTDLAERMAENDRRRAQRDYIDRHGLHISEAYIKHLDPAYEPLPEPKFTYAKLLAIGNGVKPGRFTIGDRLMVQRNYGCILPNKQWILNLDLVVGVMGE